jgi:hypothetical protein
MNRHPSGSLENWQVSLNCCGRGASAFIACRIAPIQGDDRVEAKIDAISTVLKVVGQQRRSSSWFGRSGS